MRRPSDRARGPRRQPQLDRAERAAGMGSWQWIPQTGKLSWSANYCDRAGEKRDEAGGRRDLVANVATSREAGATRRAGAVTRQAASVIGRAGGVTTPPGSATRELSDAVHYLGAGVPVHDLANFARERRPAITGLSCTMVAGPPQLADAVLAVHEAAPATRILLGGVGVPTGLRRAGWPGSSDPPTWWALSRSCWPQRRARPLRCSGHCRAGSRPGLSGLGDVAEAGHR